MSTVEELQNQARAQAGQITELVAAIKELRTAPASASAASATPPAPQGTGSVLQPCVDTRLIGKPDTYLGQRAKWPEWSFVFRAYLAALDSRYPALLARAEATASVVTNASLEPWEASLSAQLYYVMVMLFRDAAQDKMSTIGAGEGLEAWRQAILDWDPKIRTRKVGLLIKIPTAKFSGDIPQSLDQFEHLVREYEGQAGKQFDEDLKIGIVIVNMVDTSIQQHLVKNSARLETWKALKEELLDMARTEQYLNSLPKPIELGATPKAGRDQAKARRETERANERRKENAKARCQSPKGRRR